MDGKGQINESTKSDDDVHLINAIKRLNHMENDGLAPLYVILTGYIDQYKFYEGIGIRVFRKGRDELEMLNFLKEKIKDSDEYKARYQFPDIFEIFDKNYLTPKHKGNFITIYKKLNGQHISEEESALTLIRRFLEGIYRKLNQVNCKIVPDYLLNDEGIKVGEITTLIAGSPRYNKEKEIFEVSSPEDCYMPLHIYYLAQCLQKVGSAIGAHDHHRDGKYILKSQFYTLLEILIWFKTVVDQNQKNNG